MKTTIIAVIIGATAATLAARAASRVDTTNTWDAADLDGWTHVADVKLASLAATNGQLELTHKYQSEPAFVVDVLKRPIAYGALVSDVTFTLRAFNTAPSRVRLQLHAADSGSLWQVALATPSAGETRSYEVPITFAAGWSKGAYSTEDRFLQDLRSIDWIGVEILRHGSTYAQNYALDDFRIKGIQFTGDADMDYMADSWEETHGFDTNDFNDAALDADGDGMSNHSEYWAGTDPGDSNSLFFTEIDRISAGGETVSFELRWLSRENRGYTVWLSTNLSSGFELIEGQIGPTPPTNVYEAAAETNQGPRFYRVEIEPEI